VRAEVGEVSRSELEEAVRGVDRDAPRTTNAEEKVTFAPVEELARAKSESFRADLTVWPSARRE
jgi:hypothetical protein